MDEIESDHLLVVPDTPEKPTTTHKSIFKHHTNSNCGARLYTCPGNERSIFKGTGDTKRVIHVKKNCSTPDKHNESFNHVVTRFTGSLPSPANGGCNFQRFSDCGESSSLHCEKVNCFTLNNTQVGETKGKYTPDNCEISFKSPARAFRNRRLVRNGCISPSNISMPKQAPDCPKKAGVDVIEKDGMSHSRHQCVDGPHKDRSEAKGKSILDCSTPSTENDSISRHPASRCEGFGGWRSIRRKPSNLNEGNLDEYGGNPTIESLVGPHEGEKGPECNRVDLIHSLVQEPVGFRNSHPISNGCTDSRKGDGALRNDKRVKRLRMKGPISACGSSEVIVIGSPAELSISDVSRSRRHRHMSCHNTSVIEINESPGSATNRVSDGRDHAHTDYSYAMERQQEEDEILALKIQEQLYNECSAVNEVDLQLARSLQLAAAPSSRSRTVSVHRNSSYRGASPRPLQARLNENHNRRGNEARDSTTTSRNRVSVLRRHIRNQPNTRRHRNRALSSSAGLDMEFGNMGVSLDNMLNICMERMDILEAMEETFGDPSNAHDGGALGVGLDLDLNDYEMLLALDENNHEHRGAEAHRINTLPESVVQGDTFVEHCVICLEIPKSGDLIRHLPCLHKFHKHCIDAWLGRKTSCPVCNSSVF